MPSPSLPNPYPIELTAPDLSAYTRGNVGIPYAWRLEGAAPGPSAVISALVHGNELCGAIALDWLLRSGFRPACGALTLVFANIAAYEAFDPADPSASRYVDEDFNRVWDADVLDGPRNSVELARARQIRPIIAGADWLLDLHSMQNPAPPLMLAGPCGKGARLAAAVGVPDCVIMDRGHAAGRRMRDYGPFSDEGAPAAALLLEAGQHWEAAAAPRSQQAVARFLAHLGMDDGALSASAGVPEALAPQQLFQVTEAVTIQSGAFQFVREVAGAEIIAEAGSLLATDGGREIRTPYADCMLVMPTSSFEPGTTAVRLARRIAPQA